MPEIKNACPQWMGMTIFQNLIGFVFAYFLEKGGLSFPEVWELKGAALASSLYIAVAYILMFRQGLSKMINAEHATSQDPIVVNFFANVNRSFENCSQQMPIFLGAFFFYTILVNPGRAAFLGFSYTFFLIMYPILYDPTNITAVFWSTMPRYFINFFMIWALILAAVRTHPPTPTPASKGYDALYKGVYSNSKYLADFPHPCAKDADCKPEETLKKCEDMCDNWGTVCPEVCDDKHACLLSNDKNARFFKREVSCKKECVGFNHHSDDGHCTLFSDNLVLRHGGNGQWYGSPGNAFKASDPKLFLTGDDVESWNLLTPFSLVVGLVASAGLGFLAVRWVRRPHHAGAQETVQNMEDQPFASEE